MLKVICIDGKPTKIGRKPLPELVPLEATQIESLPDYYFISGYEYCHVYDCYVSWHKRRFIPLSDIDETELVKEREQLQTF